MNVAEALRLAEVELASAVESPRTDSEVLLQHVLGCTRAQLWTNPGLPVPSDYLELVERRRLGEPLQYVTGRAAFMDLELEVGPGALVPRPETEVVAQVAMDVIDRVASPVVVDVGTGSGAIALAVAKSRPDAEIWALDVSEDALAWAQRNAASNRLLHVTFLVSDLFQAIPARLRGSVDLIVANPPYLSAKELESAPEDVKREPVTATVSGPDGDEISLRIIDESREFLVPGGWLVIETSPRLAGPLADVMSRSFLDVVVSEDLAGRDRVVRGARR